MVLVERELLGKKQGSSDAGNTRRNRCKKKNTTVLPRRGLHGFDGPQQTSGIKLWHLDRDPDDKDKGDVLSRDDIYYSQRLLLLLGNPIRFLQGGELRHGTPKIECNHTQFDRSGNYRHGVVQGRPRGEATKTKPQTRKGCSVSTLPHFRSCVAVFRLEVCANRSNLQAVYFRARGGCASGSSRDRSIPEMMACVNTDARNGSSSSSIDDKTFADANSHHVRPGRAAPATSHTPVHPPPPPNPVVPAPIIPRRLPCWCWWCYRS